MGRVKSSFHVQIIIHNIFFEIIGNGVFIYFDDIFVYALNFNAFILLLRGVLERFWLHELRSKR